MIVVELGADRYITFIELDKRTNAFVKKIGTDKAELLPWPVLIENGEAKALKAEYFIAISYPLLDLRRICEHYDGSCCRFEKSRKNI